MSTKPDFSGIIKSNPCGFIPRQNIEKATNGLIKSKYLANLDSDPNAEGIKGRFRVGRKICYPVGAVVDFLEKRSQLV